MDIRLYIDSLLLLFNNIKVTDFHFNIIIELGRVIFHEIIIFINFTGSSYGLSLQKINNIVHVSNT